MFTPPELFTYITRQRFATLAFVTPQSGVCHHRRVCAQEPTGYSLWRGGTLTRIYRKLRPSPPPARPQPAPGVLRVSAS